MSAPTKDSYEDAAWAAYNGYADANNWHDNKGFTMPAWSSLTEPDKVAWRAAARAVIENYDEARTQPFPQQLAPETESATEADSLPDGGESLGSVEVKE